MMRIALVTSLLLAAGACNKEASSSGSAASGSAAKILVPIPNT